MKNLTIKLNNLVELTPEYVLSKVSEQQIYEYYNGSALKSNQLSLCKFHKDSNPSMGFYRRRGSDKIRYNCFSCGSTGGVFDFVMGITGLGFKEALESIIDNLIPISNNVCVENEFLVPSIPPNTHIEYRNFDINDVNYWGKFHITLENLLKFNVKAVKRFFYRKIGWTKYALWGVSTEKFPIYSYHFGEGMKVYNPLTEDKHKKWFQTTNPSALQGLQSLKRSGDVLFITSSLKDCMVLYNLGYSAIAPNAELQQISEDTINELKVLYNKKKIVYFNDSDEAGYKGTFKNMRKGDYYIFIPKYYNTKDISDFVKSYGMKEGNVLVKRLLEWQKII